MIELQSAKNTIASADTPNIAQGGVSSSTALNKIHGNIRTDLMEIDLGTRELLEDVTDLVTIASQQAAALAVAYSNLSAELTSVTTALATGATPQTRLVMFMPTLTSDQATTAEINRKFGQVTLPIVGETDWLSTKDMEGNTYIPDQTNLRIALPDSESAYNNLESYQFWEVGGYRNTFDKNEGSVWYHKNTGGDTYLAVWVDVPADLLLGVSANCLELSPFPLLVHDLVDVTLLLNNGTMQTLDLSEYSNPGYNIATDTINSFGNVRFIFSPTQVRGIKLLIKLNSGYSFAGFTDIALKTLHFNKSGVLSLDISDYAAYNVTNNSVSRATPALVGDLQDYLSTITPTTDSDVYHIVYNLTQLSSGLTPVITAVDVVWS